MLPVQKLFLPFNNHEPCFLLHISPVSIGAPVCCTVAHIQNPDEIRAPWFVSD
jgi:hypothetical protein